MNQRIEEHLPLHIFPLIPSFIGAQAGVFDHLEVFVTESKMIQEQESDIHLKQKENIRQTTIW